MPRFVSIVLILVLNSACSSTLRASQADNFQSEQSPEIIIKPAALKTLQLNSQQLEGVEEIIRVLQKDLHNLEKEAPGRGLSQTELGAGRTSLVKSATDEFLATLNADQKRVMKELTGGPFEVRLGGAEANAIRPVISVVLQQHLNLTPEQKSRLDNLHGRINRKLATILTPNQLKQLKEMQQGVLPGRAGKATRTPPK